MIESKSFHDILRCKSCIKVMATKMKHSIRLFFIFIVLSTLLTSCAGYDFSRKNVQQGNILSKARVDRLKIGMSKSDVAILMGTSAISPLFNNDRWDYAYTWRKANKPLSKRYLVLTFKNDRLVNIERMDQPFTR